MNVPDDLSTTLAPLQQRIREFSELIVGATAARDVAIYRAHRRGATGLQLAGWSELELGEVRAVIADLDMDAGGVDVDRDGPRWRILYC